MPAGRRATFYIFSHDLGQYFEIRWLFSDDEWTATIHPMGGASRQCSGTMAEAFGPAFARVFEGFGAAHVIPNGKRIAG